jgi:hypothetical protein
MKRLEIVLTMCSPSPRPLPQAGGEGKGEGSSPTMKRDAVVSRNYLRSCKANIPQILAGIGGLCLGALVYLFGRSPESYGFGLIVRDYLGFIHPHSPLFGFLADNLPSFTHVFAFSLMTAGLLGPGRKGTLLICLMWFSIDTAFEIGQGFKTISLAIIPEWIKVHPVPMADLQEYFRCGTFDIRDIVACLLGALAAFWVAEIMRAPFRREWLPPRF